MRLAHGWTLAVAPGIPAGLVRDFVRPAVRAVPPALVRLLGPCRITLTGSLGRFVSEWDAPPGGLAITVATAALDPHDATLELLVCLGQAAWERLPEALAEIWWRRLDAELRARVAGEIDEDALAAKRRLLANRAAARSPRRLEAYGAASFAATLAEYVHSLWHDVTVRSGPRHLPAPVLRRRLELLAAWFPPGRGYKLFPA